MYLTRLQKADTAQIYLHVRKISVYMQNKFNKEMSVYRTLTNNIINDVSLKGWKG